MRGGKRPGAGRPKGVIDGTKGIRLEEQLQNMNVKNTLEYMINVLNNPGTSPERKM